MPSMKLAETPKATAPTDADLRAAPAKLADDASDSRPPNRGQSPKGFSARWIKNASAGSACGARYSRHFYIPSELLQTDRNSARNDCSDRTAPCRGKRQ